MAITSFNIWGTDTPPNVVGQISAVCTGSNRKTVQLDSVTYGFNGTNSTATSYCSNSSLGPMENVLLPKNSNGSAFWTFK